MNSRNNKESESFSLYGYFIYHVAKTNSNCNNPFLGIDWKSFHISSPTFLNAETAPDVFSDNSLRDDWLTSSSNSDGKALLDRSLKLVSESCYLPHPEKEEAGSEDAHFVSPNEQAIWEADGVGGWAALARVLEKAYTTLKLKDPQLLALLHSQIRVLMLSTLVIVVRDVCSVFDHLHNNMILISLICWRMEVILIFQALTLCKPVADPKKLPTWNYDGWSTCQAPGEDSKVNSIRLQLRQHMKCNGSYYVNYFEVCK
ncbi:unnamed protein product [Lactuca saligna]|uniref:Uncharacterized protein n=1 Tax=Lactuca saligna TaxID=75948 RepID=A0AA35YTM4_LACSI|nr:unnamed protein product [Lactuca saligna]